VFFKLTRNSIGFRCGYLIVMFLGLLGALFKGSISGVVFFICATMFVLGYAYKDSTDSEE